MKKQGNILAIVIFFIILFLILFAGFLMVTGSAIINWVFDIAVPELTNLGTAGAVNMTEISGYTITPFNNIIQSFTWLTGVIYIMMLIGSIGFAVVMRASPSKWLIGFYVLLALVIVIASIFISNIYEDFYDGNDELATRLKEHTILSFMILYSPAVFTIIVFITGIILFSGLQEEGYV